MSATAGFSQWVFRPQGFVTAYFTGVRIPRGVYLKHFSEIGNHSHIQKFTHLRLE